MDKFIITESLKSYWSLLESTYLLSFQHSSVHPRPLKAKSIHDTESYFNLCECFIGRAHTVYFLYEIMYILRGIVFATRRQRHY